MTDKTLATAMVFGMLSALVLADSHLPRVQLTVTGAKPDTGQVLVSLFDSAADFLRAPLKEAKAEVDGDGNALVSFGDLASGEYAIAVIYDENQNGKLDTGLFRIPKEKVGFSNNAKGRFGPAKWEHARFLLTDKDAIVEIQLAKAKK